MITAGAEPDDGGLESAWLPDLTPMLDVLFMLLVFLVLTANSASHAVDVALSRVDEAAVAAPRTDGAVAVAVTDGQSGWTIDGTSFADWPAARAALEARLAADPDLQVTVAGAAAAPIDRLAKVLALLQARPSASVQLLVDR